MFRFGTHEIAEPKPIRKVLLTEKHCDVKNLFVAISKQGLYMSKNCTCAENWRAIPKERRIIIEEPGAATFVGGKKTVDRSKVHVYDRDCPVHGYQEILDE